MDKLAIETVGLTKRYGDRTAVDGVDLAVPRGTVFGFLGPNGSGKTTLIRMLLGLAPASSGTFSLLGEPGTAAVSRTGAMVEEPRFHGHLTGRENLIVAASSRPAGARNRIEACLDRVGLADRGDDRVKTYSLGMRQRLGIARALLGDPELLILDEPANGLDPAGIIEMRYLIRSFALEGRTVFVSSHLLDEVERTCDHIAIVRAGKVVASGSVAELTAVADPRFAITCDEPSRGASLIEDLPGFAIVATSADLIVLRLADGTDPSDAIARLVHAGIRVSAAVPTSARLEDAFLDLTTVLQETVR